MNRIKAHGYFEFWTEEDVHDEDGEPIPGRVTELIRKQENQLEFVVTSVEVEKEVT
jgi:hypothetical protein